MRGIFRSHVSANVAVKSVDDTPGELLLWYVMIKRGEVLQKFAEIRNNA